MTLSVVRWTVDDYHRMIAAGILDDRRVELLKGEVIEMSPEGVSHAYYSSRSCQYLRRLLGEQRAEVREGHPITLPNQSEPQPDVAIVEPLGSVYLEHHPYAENVFWLIEYSNSTLAKDLVPKRQIYAEAGIPEYWVVDLTTKTLIVFRGLLNGDYQEKQELCSGTIQPIAFPELVVAVEMLLI